MLYNTKTLENFASDDTYFTVQVKQIIINSTDKLASLGEILNETDCSSAFPLADES